MLKLVLGILIVLTMYFDGRYRRIPNFITLPAIVFGLIYHTHNTGLSGLVQALLGLLVGTVLLFIPFILGGIGAGDVKFLAAIGSITGTAFVVSSFLYGAIMGGAWAGLILIRQGSLLTSLGNIGWNTMALFSSQKNSTVPLKTISDGKEWGFPYGIVMGIGAIITIVFGTPF